MSFSTVQFLLMRLTRFFFLFSKYHINIIYYLGHVLLPFCLSKILYPVNSPSLLYLGTANLVS